MPGERAVADLLESDPSLESSLDAMLELDEREGEWTFDDAPVDTGQFGKLVDRGVVEDAGDGYALSDPDAVRRALDARDGGGTDGGGAGGIGLPGIVERLRGDSTHATGEAGVRDWTGPAGLLAVVAAFVLTRVHIYAGVFRDGNVVLTVNDPYYYRALVDQLLATSANPLNVGLLADLPGRVANGEPLYVVTMWWLATLAGGTERAGALVLAWYPVVAAAITGVLVYLVGSRALGDRRLGFVAAVVLGLTPGYATRSALGYADHHPFDYLWLAATLFAFAWLLARSDPPRSVGSGPREWLTVPERVRAPTVLLGATLAGQTLAWDNSPLLLVPVALYVAVRVPADVRAGVSPLGANRPLLLALGVGTTGVLVVHLLFGWLPPVSAVVPLLLLVGAASVVALGELSDRRGWSTTRLAAAELAGAAVALVASSAAAGSAASLSRLFRAGAIGETGSLFAPSRAFGIELFGLFLVLSLPFMAWGIWRGVRERDAWLVCGVYAWYFLALAALQVRFMGQFAVPWSLFVGVGFLWLLARYTAVEPPAPFRSVDGDDGDRHPADEADGAGVATGDASWRTVAVAVAAFLVLASVSLAMVGPKVEVTVQSEGTYETAVWIGDRTDPEEDPYVFSRWSVNRVYNYFAGGNALSYRFAREHYRDFLFDDDPEAWYERLHSRTDYVVVAPLERPRGTIISHLYTTYGSRYEQRDALEHYRAVFVSKAGGQRVFTLVEGASLTGLVEPNTTVEIRTEVTVPGATFTYRTQVQSGDAGRYWETVPYPGEYTVEAGNETWQVVVPESDVENGTIVRVRG